MSANSDLIVALESLPEKTQAVVRTVSILKRAKSKRERRANRNLVLHAKGAIGVIRDKQ